MSSGRNIRPPYAMIAVVCTKVIRAEEGTHREFRWGFQCPLRRQRIGGSERFLIDKEKEITALPLLPFPSVIARTFSTMFCTRLAELVTVSTRICFTPNCSMCRSAAPPIIVGTKFSAEAAVVFSGTAQRYSAAITFRRKLLNTVAVE